MNNMNTEKSTLEEAYLGQELNSIWSLNSKKIYRRNIKMIKVCEHLGWIVEMPVSDGSNMKKKIKTDKYFTPNGLRYSISGMSYHMEVEDNSIRMLLLHSRKQSLGTLHRYIISFSKEYKQLRTAQIL